MKQCESDECTIAFLQQVKTAKAFFTLLVVLLEYFRSDNEDQDTPELVQAVPTFHRYLVAVSHIFEGEIPSLRLVRVSSIECVSYRFGDASGAGFGASWVNRSGYLSFRNR